MNEKKAEEMEIKCGRRKKSDEKEEKKLMRRE